MSNANLRRNALIAYSIAGAALTVAVYVTATTQANLNAVLAMQSGLEDTEWQERKDADNQLSAAVAVGHGEHLDNRPYTPAIDWAAVSEQVMPSVVMINGLERANGDGSGNRAWLIPGVITNLATDWLTKIRAWEQGWAEADRKREWWPLGAGFFIRDGHQVVTCGHVVNGQESVRVRLASGEVRAAHVVGVDYNQDVAVLTIEGEPGRPVPIAPAMPHQGWGVATIGMPKGNGFALSAGVVSRYGPTASFFKSPKTVQIDAPITDGNSGGVLFNSRGEAVGMISFGADSRTNWAIQIEHILAVADRIAPTK